MADLATYIRIYDADPDDDLVGKREAAIKDAISALRKTTTAPNLVEMASAAARSFSEDTTPDPLGAIVATAIKAKAPSFVREEREMEVSVISALAVAGMLDIPETASVVTIKDIVAATLWSALSFQTPITNVKHEQLRQEVMVSARDRTLNRGEVSRKRMVPREVPEFAEGEIASVEKSVNIARTSITALTNNAVLDREEIDVLWWSVSGRSPITGGAYDEIDPEARGLLRAFELGILMRRLPSQAMRRIVLSGVPALGDISFGDILTSVEKIRDRIVEAVPAHDTIRSNPIAFPLLTAVLDETTKTPAITKKGDEWVSRALLETALARLCETPDPKL
ncbi:hypothetical protein EUU23_09330 [Sphingorhabdus sp. IMCC26285]|uniref:GTPase-associated system helical domain-containing protein n=1 Tax=Sphingorhabdus profundilacus TaxID=2509718 RepID=A0A6I4LWH7_9SPHN|nr:GTPase-associated system all-helical protein GASH [Sphingorhabdus profundilacus]MVZ97907.1 hypothetical protein [Sphingorhabdus profundilacus]